MPSALLQISLPLPPPYYLYSGMVCQGQQGQGETAPSYRFQRIEKLEHIMG